jgi:transcription elongation factor
LAELERFFRPGDHVRVQAGKHSGKTGTILAIDDGIATISSDLSREKV